VFDGNKQYYTFTAMHNGMESIKRIKIIAVSFGNIGVSSLKTAVKPRHVAAN
jgi:hypothetical protein